ncbi:MAG: ABC transporter substrate-binding protein [Anaerolineales bacterium]
MRARWAALLLVVLAACRASAPSSSVRLPMGFNSNVQFAPFYVALERGYYAEEGIDLEFDYLFETDGVKLVGAGELPFSLVSGEQVLLARAQGLPVVYVMAWFQDYPIAIAAPVESGIKAPQDLAGTQIGIPGAFGASYVGLRALLHSAGLTEEDITLESIGFNQVESLVAGQEDAVVVYANNEPLQLNARGYPVNVIRVADHVDLASNGILTNESMLANSPDIVRGMIRATLRGISDTIEDPDAAFEISKKYIEGLDQLSAADLNIQRSVLAESIEFWRTDRPGFSDPQAWENMQEVLLEMDFIVEPMDLADAFSNEYLP